MDYEGTAALAASDTAVDDSTSNVVVIDEGMETTGTVTGANGFIRTEAAPAEVPKQLKHRGTITSVAALTANTGSRGIEVTCHSDSNGKDYKQTIWPPKQWTDNVFITGEELAALPAPEGVTAAGNAKQTPYQRFGRTISSTDGRAELQRIINAATKVERTLDGSYTDFDTLVANLNSGVAGTPVIFVTGPDGDPDPEYGFKIKVRNVMPHDTKFEKLRQEDAGGN